MSGSIGRCAYLPGQAIPFRPDGRECDECDTEATYCICLEADSFGCETGHFCLEHYMHTLQACIEARQAEQYCDIGKHMAFDCKPVRDPEEGTAGPVYIACPSCRNTLLSTPDEESDQELSDHDFDDLGMHYAPDIDDVDEDD